MDGREAIDVRALGRILGRGGAGEVREGSLPDLGTVAIKIAHPNACIDPRDAARAALEADALRRIDHRNVVRVLGSRRTADGRFALIVPRLVGRSLREVLDVRTRLPWSIACKLAAAVLDGLDAAHAAGVVHRDVKPSNVFIGREAGEPAAAVRPILLDFGLARLDGACAPGSTSSSVVGSPSYVAPEQVLGGAQDARTDVYAMGVVLFECITGAPPFAGADASRVLESQLLDAPPDLTEVMVVPREVARAVARALAKAPRARFASAAQMALALRVASGRSAVRRAP